MKNRFMCLLFLALGTSLQPTVALSNLPANSWAQLEECEEPKPSVSESEECSVVHTYVLPAIGGVFGTVLASGIFVLLELRWYLRE